MFSPLFCFFYYVPENMAGNLSQRGEDTSFLSRFRVLQLNSLAHQAAAETRDAIDDVVRRTEIEAKYARALGHLPLRREICG